MSIKNVLVKSAAAAVMAATVSMTAPAGATGMVAGATEITQIMNNLQLVLQYAKQAEQLVTQINQYENMLKNTAMLPKQVWSMAEQDLGELSNVVRMGRSLAYSADNISDQFKQRFPGYTGDVKVSAKLKDWNETMMDTIGGSMAAANLQAKQFNSEEATLRQLRSMSETADGQQKALQVGNQVAIETATQMQKLRALVASQMQMQATYMAQQEGKDVDDKSNVDRFFPLKRHKFGTPSGK